MGEDRRVAVAALALSVVLGTLVPTAGAGAQGFDHHADLLRYSCPQERVPELPFRDVDPASTHALAIACVTWWRIAQGRVDGTFDPGGAVSRAQMATFVHRFLLVSGVRLDRGTPSPFVDVSGTHAAAIAELAAAGVVRGATTTTFAPDRPVTRAQAASLLSRATLHVSGLPMPATEQRFDDVGGVHADAVHHLAHLFVAAGTGPRTFSPDRPVTRAQMATFIARLQGSQVMMRHVLEHWHPTFHPAERPVPDVLGTAAAAGDLDGDGRTELVLVAADETIDDGDRYNRLLVARTQVDDGIAVVAATPTISSDTHYPVRSVAIADVTGDGHPEVVVPGVGGDLEAWRLSRSDELRRLEVDLPMVDHWSVLRTADVDGDGRADLLTRGAGHDDPLLIHRQTARGSFAAPLSVAVLGWHGSDLVTGDLTGDGSDEIVVTGLEEATVVTVREGRVELQHLVGDAALQDAWIGDVTGDGRTEVLTTRSRTELLPVGPDGRVGTGRPLTGPGPAPSGALTVADLTGDGVTDIGTWAPYLDRMEVLVGDGHGGLSWSLEPIATRTAAPLRRATFVFDATGDGVDDVVAATFQHGLLLLRGY